MKRIALASFILLLFCACGKKNSYTIDGKLAFEGFSGKQAYLYDVNDSIIDSALIENGSFLFQGSVDNSAFAYIRTQRGDNGMSPYIDFILEPGTIHVDLFNDTVYGTALNEAYFAFTHDPVFQDFIAQAQALERQYYSAPTPQEREAVGALYDTLMMQAANVRSQKAEVVLNDNPDNILGAIMFFNIAQNPAITLPELEQRIAKVSPVVANFPPTQTILSRLRHVNATAVGNHYADFEAVDFATGEKTTLSLAINGRLAIVDFWASWCSPCRQEIKDNLLSLSKKYEGRVLFLGVDVWDKPDKHRAAVQELGITYPQIIVEDKSATDLYGIEGIPHIMLVAADGTILARDLRGADIEAAIEKALQ